MRKGTSDLPPCSFSIKEQVNEVTLVATNMKSLAIRVVAVMTFASNAAGQTCDVGFQPFGERCISQRMADFITCVERSGGNKESVAEEIRSRAPSNTQLKRADEVNVASNVTRFFTGAMRECGRIVQDADSLQIDITKTLLEIPGLEPGMSLPAFRVAFARRATLQDSNWNSFANGDVAYSYSTAYSQIPGSMSHYFKDGKLLFSRFRFEGVSARRSIGREEDINFSEVNDQKFASRESFLAACGSSLEDSQIWAALLSRFSQTPVKEFDRRWDYSAQRKEDRCTASRAESDCVMLVVNSHRKYQFERQNTRAVLEEKFEHSDQNYLIGRGESPKQRFVYWNRSCTVVVTFTASS